MTHLSSEQQAELNISEALEGPEVAAAAARHVEAGKPGIVAHAKALREMYGSRLLGMQALLEAPLNSRQ